MIGILGPLEVLCADRRVPISGHKERGLLVRLALEHGRVVSVEQLIAALWDGDPPSSAAVSVRVLVSRVRRAFAAAGAPEVIQTRAPGYVLRVGETDLDRFEELARQGRAALASDRPAEAAAALSAALGLWRGDGIADAGTEALRTAAVRITQQRRSVQESRFEAELACARHAAVLGELQALCGTEPLHEGLWALWITALYRSARQADALGAYQELKATLAEELGIDPSPRLQRLEAAVLAQDPALEPPATGGLREDRLPFPAPLAVPERAPHVGRAREFAAARAAWLHVRDGGGGAVLVSGAAGIGKSRLLRELARDAHRAGSTVLYGRCDEDLAIPYRPFVECLSQVVTAAGDTTLAALGPARLAELGRMVPSVAERRVDPPAPAGALGDVERYQLFGAVAALLTSLAARSPVVVLLDDLQWADRPTLQLLRHLVGLNVGSILFVGAHRDVARPSAPLVEHLGRLPVEAVLARIALGGLAAEDASTLLSATVGAQLDGSAGALAGRLCRESAGNPYYLGEMFRHLLETGVITAPPHQLCTAGVDPDAAGLPASIRDLLLARLDALGPDVARVLYDASVIGEQFRFDLLAGSERDEDTVLDLLDMATRAGLVVEDGEPPGGFRFAHALVQHTLYRELGPARRTRVHTRVALAMEELGGFQPGELAYQFLAGATAETAARAIRYAREAGRRALTASAPDEAVRWYTAALQALPLAEEAERVRTMIDLGVAQRHAGKPEFRASLLTAARAAERIGRDDLLIDAAVATNRGSFSSLGSVDTDKIDVLRAALLVAAPDTAASATCFGTCR